MSVLSVILGKCCTCRGLGCPSSEAVSANQNIPTCYVKKSRVANLFVTSYGVAIE